MRALAVRRWANTVHRNKTVAGMRASWDGRRARLSAGEVFGRLTVLAEAGRDKRGDVLYRCRCTCGRETTPTVTNLRRGASRSCGHHSRPPEVSSYVRPDSALKRMLRTYKRGARRRGLVFELTFEQFTKCATSSCFYCGAEPAINSYSAEAKVPVAVTGIDRRDSSQGYTMENTVACCGICNSAKSDLSMQDFINWLRRAAKHLEGAL
jgi:hypothetical protein